MPVRPDVVRRKLLDIGETVGHLRSLLPITVERLERDVTLRWAVEHGLYLAAESLFDAGNHILAAEFHEVPDDTVRGLLRSNARHIVKAIGCIVDRSAREAVENSHSRA